MERHSVFAVDAQHTRSSLEKNTLTVVILVLRNTGLACLFVLYPVMAKRKVILPTFVYEGIVEAVACVDQRFQKRNSAGGRLE
tara:strand:+ start:1739 stop:1987 length:249 start_codon:yes stop_codon:yes gene_type:complete